MNESIRVGLNPINIENMILSTFLFLNELGLANEVKNDVFKLDDRVFTSPLRKRIAKKLNDIEDEAYSFLCCQIEDSVINTAYEMEFMDVITQTSLPLKVVKKYHDRLLVDNKMKGLI